MLAIAASSPPLPPPPRKPARPPAPAAPGRATDSARAHRRPGPRPAPAGTAVVGPGETAPGPAVAPPGVPVPMAAPGMPVLEPDVQVVRFQGPPGLMVEVLAPTPSPVPSGDGGGIITVGLKRGVGYRLKLGGIRRTARQGALPRHRNRRPPPSARKR